MFLTVDESKVKELFASEIKHLNQQKIMDAQAKVEEAL